MTIPLYGNRLGPDGYRIKADGSLDFDNLTRETQSILSMNSPSSTDVSAVDGTSTTPKTTTRGYTDAELRGLLGEDPWWKQFQKDVSGESISDRSRLDGILKDTFIREGGFDLGRLKGMGFGDYLGAVESPDVLRLSQEANKSGLSGKARRQFAHEQAQKDLRALLASRGILDSGEIVVGEERLGRERRDLEAEAVERAMSMIRGAIESYVNAERGRKRELGSAQMEAWRRILELYGDGTVTEEVPVTETTTPPPSDSTTTTTTTTAAATPTSLLEWFDPVTGQSVGTLSDQEAARRRLLIG